MKNFARRVFLPGGLVAAILFAATPSLAQQLPYAWPQTIGTSPAQVLPSNTSRKQVLFHNPNANASIAVCPALSRKDGSSITCAVNGAGSITLVPGGSAILGGVGSPTAAIPSAWNGVASAAGSAITILEWE